MNHYRETLAMQIEILLSGCVRSKKNSKIATMVGGRNMPRRAVLLPSAAYRKWEKAARMEVAAQWRGGLLTCPVHCQVTAYYKGKQPDLSGVLESIGDCLEGLVWADDRQIVSWDGSRLYHNAKNPRTKIMVYMLGG